MHAFIEDNCERIIFEHENETDCRKNDIKAGDNEDDKTIKTSNKWNEKAAQGQNNNYCPEYECGPISEEDFNEFCCVDEYQDQRQPEYAGDQQGYRQDEGSQYEPIMPQPTNEMHKAYLDRVLMDEGWQPNWTATRYTTRGAAWQAISEQPWVQQTRRMEQDNKSTPENMAKTRLPP